MSQRDRSRRDEDGRTPRGYRIQDFARLEGVSERTVRTWAEKGALRVSRMASRSGVRVDYLEPPNR
jgi:hypothetical protein